MSTLNVRTFCVITGASRGLGRESAIQLAEKVGDKSLFCLVARGQEALEETARAVRAKSGGKVESRCISADLTDEHGVVQVNQAIYAGIGDVSNFEAAIIFHNAGSVSDVVEKYARDLDDIAFVQRYNMLKLSGPIVMTSEFFKVFAKPGSSVLTTVIQTTSMTATRPMKTAHLYCMCHAARDMFFKVLALEEPKVRVLSFDPGFVETRMLTEDINVTPDEDTRAFVTSANFFLKPERAIQGLVQTLEEDKYKSGAVVKCYDVLGIKAEF